MTVTILKPLGTWQAARLAEAGAPRRTPLHGRVLTGLLTVDEPDRPPDPEARTPR